MDDNISRILNIGQNKGYRNPRFEKFVFAASKFADISVGILTYTLFIAVYGVIVTFIVMFIHRFLQIMQANPIYFVDNRGIGPDWKQELVMDIVSAFRHVVLYVIGGYSVQVICRSTTELIKMCAQ